MELDNFYLQEYDKLINRAKNENRQKLPICDKNYVCYHDHHIVPKSINPLLDKEKSNHVLLTPGEHFDAHYFLWKGHPEDSRYAVAFYFICHCRNDGRTLSKEEYELLKTQEALYLSEIRKGENNPMYGKNAYEGKSKEEMEEIGQKISDSLTGMKKGIVVTNPATNEKIYVENEDYIPEGFIKGGPKHTKETRQKMSKSAKLRGAPSCAFRDKSGENNPMFGKTHTEESILKQKETILKKKLSDPNYGVKNKHAYHNPQTNEQKYFCDSDVIPDGWVRGCKKKKTPKT